MMHSGDSRTSLLILILACVLPSASHALTCANLPTDKSPVSYRVRSDPPRCEGVYIQPVSGAEGMSLVSFTRGRIAYDVNVDRTLDIALPGQADEAISVRGIGVRLGLFYRLDVELTKGEHDFHLPLRDVIAVAPNPIKNDELGLFGQRSQPGGLIGYVPVSASAGQPASTHDDLLVSVRPGSDTQHVSWRVLIPNQPSPLWKTVPGTIRQQGSRIDVDIGAALNAPRVILEISYFIEGQPRSDRFVLLAS